MERKLILTKYKEINLENFLTLDSINKTYNREVYVNKIYL